jgi:hypothetical protein
MLVRALTQHFQSYLDSADSHTVVLWFDPDREYEALLPHLTGVTFWCYEGSLLRLRYRLIHRPAGEKTVVYLPMRPEDAEVLRPFFATSLLFTDRLYKFLRRQGLDFPDDPQVAHELRALLPRLAARSIGKGRDFWTYNLANLERARETLIGSFDDALLRFLAAPAAEWARLKGEQIDGLFAAQLESTYGLATATEGDPDDLARRFTAQIALVQAFTDAGQPGDFPYRDRLPEPLAYDRCCAFLARWQRDAAYKAAYVRLADGLQTRYNLAGCATALPESTGLALGATFANVEDALWAKIEAAMAGLEGEPAWRTWLAQGREQFAARAAGFWAAEGRAPGWGLLARAADLLATIHAARSELDGLVTPAGLLVRYAEAWWRIDRDFRILREGLDAHEGLSYERLRDRCNRSYRDILGRMNDRFTALLRAESVWPADALPRQDGFWAGVFGQPGPAHGRPAKGAARRGKVAIMFVDALRYELGQALHAALTDDGAGDDRHITARLAAIPTVTPIGMTALLPGGERRAVSYGNDWNITIETRFLGETGFLASGNLKDKAARRSWLEAHAPGVAFYNLSDLLNTPAGRLPEAPVTIVFDATLDAVGENAGSLALSTFSALLQNVKRGIHKLLGLGISEVHVVADHGFLLLEEIGEHEKASAKSVPALALHERYLLGRGLGKTEQVAFPVPGGDDLIAWYPLGIGCFKTPGPYNYVHGGLSLQELVIPHLTITQQSVGRPVGVRAELPTRITGQFKVVLEPVVTSTTDQPRQVTLALEAAGQPVAPPLSCVVEPGGSVEQTILLPMGCGLESGQRVRWVLADAVTGEVLAEQDAVSQVDLW